MKDVNTVIEGALEILDRTNAESQARTGFDSAFEIRTAEFALLVQRMAAYREFEPQRVLEVGCGIGFSLLLWGLVAPEVVGVDLPHVASGARRFLSEHPTRSNITIHPGDITTLHTLGRFDLVVSQYVLEHVPSIPDALASVRHALVPGGLALHVVPGAVDRHAWYIDYRARASAPRRIWNAVRSRRPHALIDPTVFTPPHAPEFGPFVKEHDEYRLERWALHFLRAGFRVVDYFQTRDVNWVIVTVYGDGPERA